MELVLDILIAAGIIWLTVDNFRLRRHRDTVELAARAIVSDWRKRDPEGFATYAQQVEREGLGGR